MEKVKESNSIISDKNTDIETLIAYMEDDERYTHHTKYFHYTDIGSLNKILESKSLKMSKLWYKEKANDYIEQEWYSKNGKNLFSFCLCTGTSESLPLWYLYSGVDGQGARIEFSKKAIIKLIKNSKVYIRINDKKNILEKSKYEIYAYDILYLGKDATKDAYRIKYNDKIRNNISKKEYDTIQSTYKKCPKGLIWFYEKETRLEIKITDEEILKNENYDIFLDISEIIDLISVRLGPQADEQKRDDIINEPKNIHIKKFIHTKLQLSDYKGEIKINIKNKHCDNCKNKKCLNVEGQTK